MHVPGITYGDVLEMSRRDRISQLNRLARYMEEQERAFKKATRK